MIDSLCRLGRLKDSFQAMVYMGSKAKAIRDNSRKSLLKQLCYALVTNGRNDKGGHSKFQYEDLLDAIAECICDLLISPTMHSPTQKMRLARNFIYYMQGLQMMSWKRGETRSPFLAKRGEHENDSMLAWIRK